MEDNLPVARDSEVDLDVGLNLTLTESSMVTSLKLLE